MQNEELFNPSNSATYCPEDNKLRLYVGRVPRDEYDALIAEGWQKTPKQDCDFAAVWTPAREDTALSYAGEIDDEDTPPTERAADRAERFGGYLDKRTAEAIGHADSYDSKPEAYGFQSQARAERLAVARERIGDRACTQWAKAEYWHRRTQGVISHALHVSSPSVRMGRIKTLEAELRKEQAHLNERKEEWRIWHKILTMDGKKAQSWALTMATRSHGYHYRHPRPETCDPYYATNDTSLYLLMKDSQDPISAHEAANLWLKGRVDPESPEWYGVRYIAHLKLRLAYENQMLEAQGGRLASAEIEKGGKLGGRVIAKVNKSPKTGRVVSVAVIGPAVQGYVYQATNEPGTEFALYTIETERLAPGAYTPPDDEIRAALAVFEGAKKAAAKKRKESTLPCPLINPTPEDAERLQAWLNAIDHAAMVADHQRRYGAKWEEYFKYANYKPSTVLLTTQATYSANSKGAYSAAETRGICKNGVMEPRVSNMYSQEAQRRKEERGPALCQVRTASGDGHTWGPRRIVVLTDKPQKPLPAAIWPVEQPVTA
jgi:hypothetical protein